MVEISDQARAIMRENAQAGGRRGQNAIPVDMRTQSQGFMSRVRETLNVWMGPGRALTPVAPEGTPARSWDYPIFYNYSIQPDQAKAIDSGVSMYQLKMLSNQTHVALARGKARRKQQKKRWSFGLVKQPGERAHETLKRAANDPRIKVISDFFQMPDGENELPEWLGLNLENIFTLGVTSIVPWRTKSGEPFRLEVYDPATIVPKIDASGRRPMGIDPETGKPAVAFQQYIKGVPSFDFSDENMLWYGPNPVAGKVFPVGPTEALMLYINIAYRRDAQRIAHFTDGNIAAGFLPMPAGWTPQQIEQWYKQFNIFLVNLPQNLAKLVPVPYAGAGGAPVFPQLDALKDGWEETWLRLVFAFFDVPVSTLVKEMTKANASGNQHQADEEGEQYYEDVCRRLITRCIAKWWGWTDITCRTEAEVETDLSKQAEIDVSRVSKGLDQVNEIRDRDGKDPIRALIGVEGYFNSSGDFTPFDVALSNPDVEEDDREDADPDATPVDVTVETDDGTKKVAKASKKNSTSHSASRTYTRSAQEY